MTRYRILGPLEVLDDEGCPVTLGGRIERVLLATLLLEANRVVSTDRLVEAAWGEHPPEKAANALQVHISKLRRALSASSGTESPLYTQAPGYVLRISPGDLDSEHFEELAQAASSVERPESVSTRLAEALALWSGRVLDGLETDVTGRSDVARLEELRVSVLERRIEADLALGRHRDLISELEALVHTYPLREELRGQLMLALYRSGRQAEALRVYRQTREVLAEELGIEPNPALQELELAILNQSPDLKMPISERKTDKANDRADFPALRSLDNPNMPNNLPDFVSSFVGRGEGLAEVRNMIEQSRLVTLAGPGGVGKTRLALQVAAGLLDASGDGVWLVELANVVDPDAVPSEVARSLRINEQAGGQIYEILVEALADQYALIVLDNCEHLIGASAKLADVLVRNCPRVHLLVTSREPLGIDGETVFRVPPLSMPVEDSSELPELETSESVTLFVERARAHTAGFALSNDSAPLVAAICRRLDGMPLAIELAVARLRSLSLSDLNNRLDRRFQLLTGGSRSALPRNQTLRGVVDWSYDLLTATEQVLLGRLSVFSGGFELDAAEKVCGFGSIEGFDVAVLLGGLVDKSLVVTETLTLQIRYRLLETIRQYSAERLADANGDETRQLFDAHAEFYLGYAEAAAPQLAGPEQGAQIARIRIEYSNLYTALEHLSKRGGQRQSALRLAVALRHFWHLVGASNGEILLLDGILAKYDPEIPASLLAAGLLCKADLLRSIDLAASVHSGDEALDLARRCGDPRLLADVLSFHSITRLFFGDSQEALSLAKEAISFARRCDDPLLIGASLNCLANALEDSDPSLAERLYGESITLGDQLGNWSGLWRSHNNLGYLLMLFGRLSEAQEHLESALVAASKIGSDVYTAFSHGNLGWIRFREGDVNGAATNFGVCIRVARRSGQIRRIFSNVACGLAACATHDGDAERAAALHGISQTSLEAYGGNWDPNEQGIRDADLAQLRRTLGISFERCYKSGRMMERDEAFSFVLNF
jgi:predicted ATPase/DNA-binding SARP family transcriptional activator